MRLRHGPRVASARAASASAVTAGVDGGAALRRVLPFVLYAALGALLFGYHLGVVNAALEPLSAELGIVTAAAKGTVVSTVLVGAFAGSVAGGWLADAFGRRGALLRCTPPLLAGAALCAGASSVAMLLAGRLLCGMGIGAASAVVPIYIAELAPASQRGALGSLNQLSICSGTLPSQCKRLRLSVPWLLTLRATGAGLLLALVVGLPLGEHPHLWRFCFALSALPALALLAFSGTQPGPPAAPSALLRKVRTLGGDINSDAVPSTAQPTCMSKRSGSRSTRPQPHPFRRRLGARISHMACAAAWPWLRRHGCRGAAVGC